MEIKVGKSHTAPLCLKMIYTKNLCIEFRQLYNTPKYIGTRDFQKAMDHYGIKTVCADAAAKPHLDNCEIVEELLSNLSLMLRVNLSQSLGGTGVKMLIDNELNMIYFLKSKENIRIFSLIGFSTSELRFGRKGEDCPDINQLKRLFKGDLSGKSDASEMERVERHVENCPDCQDIIDRLAIKKGSD
jgi:hypothetical protein